MAIQLNIVRQTQHHVCFSSQVNMATADIATFTHLSKSPAKSQISHWSLPSESKRVDALLFKPNYAHAFKNQGYKNSKPPVTKSHMTHRVCRYKEKNMVTICSRPISMSNMSKWQHFPVLSTFYALRIRKTKDMKIQNFLSRNRQKNRLS